MILDLTILALVVLLSIPLLTLSIECFLSLWPQRRAPALAAQRSRCGILIPAHNEESGLKETLEKLKPHLLSTDRVVVIADNCDDGTANVARSFGVEVSERSHATDRGKGFALAHGLDYLKGDLPQTIVIVDADCELAPGALDAIVSQSEQTNLPAQGVYFIGTGQEPELKRRVSAFAVAIKNHIRPLGMHNIGGYCTLTGTGMAIPSAQLLKANLATGNIVEDMRLGVDLALMGHPPKLCPQATLSGLAAPDQASTKKQRTRWEHGHIKTILSQGPKLLLKGIFTFKPKLVLLALELGVPPVSLVLATWMLITTAAIAYYLLADGCYAPMSFALGVWILTILTVGFAWYKHARQIIQFKHLCLIPAYILWKLPIYSNLLLKKATRWERTSREVKK